MIDSQTLPRRSVENYLPSPLSGRKVKPCEYPEYPQSSPVNIENTTEKTQGGDVSKVSNVSKYSRNSQYSHEYSHQEKGLCSTSKQEKTGHSQNSHCFQELLTSKVIA